MAPSSRNDSGMNHYAIDALQSALPRFANFKMLGQGGEGAVFAVWDRIRKANLALKVMVDTGEPELAEDPEILYRNSILREKLRLNLAYQRSRSLKRDLNSFIQVSIWPPML